ncbi:MAG: hypothetical protein AAF485_19450 [Chloroflexota bacterium]
MAPSITGPLVIWKNVAIGIIMSIHERISAVVSLILIGLVSYIILDVPGQLIDVPWFDVSILVPQRGLLIILLAGLAMAGMDKVIRTQPDSPAIQFSYAATFWMLPGLLVAVATQALGLASTPIFWLVGIGVAGGLLWLTMMAGFKETASYRLQTDQLRWGQLWEQLMGYSLALACFLLIYQLIISSVSIAVGIFFVTVLLALPLLRQRPENVAKTWLFSLVIGLSLAQIGWVFSYWHASPIKKGLLLLITFYICISLARQQLTSLLSRKTVWEFSTIAVIALLIVFSLQI